MPRRLLAFALLLASPALVACPPPDDTDTGSSNVAPELTHTPPDEVLLEGEGVEVAVTVADTDGVVSVTLYHRVQGSRQFTAVPLQMSEGAESTDAIWFGQIPGSSVRPPAVEYYFQATEDTSEALVGTFPSAGELGPVVLPIQEVGRGLPYLEPFEDSPSALLRELNWSSVSVATGGYDWQLRDNASQSGARSVAHLAPPGDEPAAIEDWLLAPSLDFTTFDRLQVSWWERGNNAEAVDHKLMVSTGSGDPADGEFVEVATLPAPPEQEWGRSAVYDLSDYAGEQAVHLAWVYRRAEGEVGGDDWYLDDIEVTELGPDLRLQDVVWTPDPVRPGESGTLTVTVRNTTAMPASGAQLAVATPEGGAVFTSPVDIGTFNAITTLDIDVPFTVDEAWPDNSYLPLELELSTDQGTWTWDERMVVGLPSSAVVDLQLFTPGVLTGTIGVGPVDAPTVELDFFGVSAENGPLTFDVDLTDQFAHLPPGPGGQRWWVRVDSESSDLGNPVSGTIDALSITYDGEPYVSDRIASLSPAEPAVLYVPHPPEPVVETRLGSTEPSTLAPGDAVAWELVLTNEGSATVGQTAVVVTSDDPAVTVTSTEPVILSGDEGWAADAQARIPVTFELSPDKKDSVPVRFDVTVTDTLESVATEASLSVPYPVLRVSGVVVDDFAAGDNDRLLDPSETSNLEIKVANLGGRGTFGNVACELSQSGGTVTVDVLEGKATYAAVSPDAIEDEDDFEVEVKGGFVGDEIEFELTCTDRQETYTLPFSVEIGRPTWQLMTARLDACGDLEGTSTDHADLREGYYRSDGETLDLWLVACEPFTKETAFIEMYARGTAAAYPAFRILLSGTGTNLYGFDRSIGGKPLTPKPTVSNPDSRSVILSVDLEPFGLQTDSMSLGMGSGYCGGANFFCDSWPDDTGSWVDGMNYNTFFGIDW